MLDTISAFQTTHKHTHTHQLPAHWQVYRKKSNNEHDKDNRIDGINKIVKFLQCMYVRNVSVASSKLSTYSVVESYNCIRFGIGI